jgi:hypothetical protein
MYAQGVAGASSEEIIDKRGIALSFAVFSKRRSRAGA